MKQHLRMICFSSRQKPLPPQVTDADLRQGSIYPSLQKIREISTKIAMAVAALAYQACQCAETQ
ncbi:malic enzyme-like NAD(P)-binding protein [Desulfococcaceae bacterium HSG8]|nr:malic enzyme-like NAD(P)-binding protein [Desulfococcaceae bacterium HSG8]